MRRNIIIASAAAATVTLALTAAPALLAGDGPHGDRHPGDKGPPHHEGPKPHKGPHHGGDSKHHRGGPTLEIELKGEGRHLELKCHARMPECLEAVERVQTLDGQGQEPDERDKDAADGE
ncbi:hypothetical protein [Thiohalorhabdus sp.]|uniref:hypothetical protein n=1 Tax=Thiohalorhabdus sp. TaxID=3094134 RepID=UPI002FC2B9BB